MMPIPKPLTLWFVLAGCALVSAPVHADSVLASTLAGIKPSIVGVGTYDALRRPPAHLLGTGFVVDSGNRAATNYHVVAVDLEQKSRERLVVFVGTGREVEYRQATLVAADEQHDLAILAFDGTPLPSLALQNPANIREGDDIAFTGFPIGAVLGLHPVTHRGIVSAMTPIVIPTSNARQLTAAKIASLREPFTVLQLDATAYPGNSGSPVYLPHSGEVVGVINQVFVKGRKEDVLSDPSAITYAIPVQYLLTLLQSN